MGRPVCLRALAAKSAVGALAVKILPPLLDEMAGLSQGKENILGQAFISLPTVEAFHKTIICGFPGRLCSGSCFWDHLFTVRL